MSQVLYFPHLSLPDTHWVNPAILFFEQIGVISPDVPSVEEARRQKLFDKRTSILVEAKVVQPIWPGRYYLWGAATDEKFLEVLLQRACEQRSAAESKLGRLHVGKFANSILVRGLLREKKIQRTKSESWVMVPRWLGDHLMTYLAVQLSSSPRLGMDLVTDDGAAWTRMTGQPTKELHADLRLRAVTSLLPVAPSVEVSELLEFRRIQHQELREFRKYVEALLRDASSASGTEMTGFEARLREAEQCREELVHALEHMRWRKVATRIGLSALPMISSAADASPWSAVAGFVPFAQQLRSEWRGRHASRKARKHPLAFAALARQRLSQAPSSKPDRE